MSLPVLLIALTFIFGAAIVRGYVGFGFSLLAIISLSLLMPPSAFVPSIFMLEIAASLHMLPGIWKSIHWRSLAPLIAGCTLGTPLGVWFLANIPTPPMQMALSAFVIMTALLLWRGFALKSIPEVWPLPQLGERPVWSMGRLGSAAHRSSCSTSPRQPGILWAGRQSSPIFSQRMPSALFSWAGLLTKDNMLQALIFLPGLLFGVWIGARSFKSADPETFRKCVLVLLMILAAISAAQALVQIASSPS